MEEGYQYQVGQEIGIRDIYDESDVRWFILLGIEPDTELTVAWFYLKSDSDAENIYDCQFGPYAEIIDSTSDRIVVMR